MERYSTYLRSFERYSLDVTATNERFQRASCSRWCSCGQASGKLRNNSGRVYGRCRIRGKSLMTLRQTLPRPTNIPAS